MDKLNLKKRGEVWYINIAVPRPLIEAAGKTHYTETTSTRDIHQARAYRDIRVPEIKKELAQYRTGKTPIAKPKDGQKLTLESLTESAKALREQIIDSSDAMDGETASEAFSYMVDNYCQTKKVTEGEVVKIRQASKLLANWNRELLTDLIETHVTELKRHVVTSTAKARSTKLMSLADFLGDGAFVDEVKKVDIAKYVEKELNQKGYTPRTIKNHLADINAFFNWAADRGYIKENIASNMTRTVKTSTRASKDNEGRREWTEDEILLTLENIKQHDKKESWLPMLIIALYSGMRRTEIAEMLQVNASEKFLEIFEGKTKSAERVVPVHRIIKPLIKKLLKHKGEYLIPDLTRGGDDNKRGHQFSNQFSKFIRRTVKIDDKGVVYHSLRNTFITASWNAKNEIQITERITGHKTEGMSAHYAKNLSYERLNTAMQKVTHGNKVDKAVIESIKNIKH